MACPTSKILLVGTRGGVDRHPPYPPIPEDREDEAIKAAARVLRERGLGVTISEVRDAIDAYNKVLVR